MTRYLLKNCIGTFAFCFALAITTHAQIASPWSFDLGLSVVTPKGELDNRYTSESAPFLQINYSFSPYLAMSAGFEYVSFKRSYEGRRTDLDIGDIQISGIIQYPFTPRWQGQVVGGMGLYFWRADAAWWYDGGPNESTDIGVHLGAGVTCYMTRHIGLSARITNHRVKFDRSDDVTRWMNYSFGMHLVLP